MLPRAGNLLLSSLRAAAARDAACAASSTPCSGLRGLMTSVPSPGGSCAYECCAIDAVLPPKTCAWRISAALHVCCLRSRLLACSRDGRAGDGQPKTVTLIPGDGGLPQHAWRWHNKDTRHPGTLSSSLKMHLDLLIWVLTSKACSTSSCRRVSSRHSASSALVLLLLAVAGIGPELCKSMVRAARSPCMQHELEIPRTASPAHEISGTAPLAQHLNLAYAQLTQ